MTADTNALPKVDFWLPHPDLRPSVTSYYSVDAAGPLRDNLHPEWGNIRFGFRGDWFIEKAGTMAPAPPVALFGPTDRTAQFTAAHGSMLGIGLTPVGWLRLIRSSSSPLANRMVPLGAHLGIAEDDLFESLKFEAGHDARVAVLDRVLLARLSTAPRLDPAVVAIQDALRDDAVVDVVTLGERVGLSERTLQRTCLRAFGFTPKRLLRRQRFLRTLDKIRERLDQPFASLVHDDYYDQAHFNREFRTYMGMSPTAYYRSPREVMRRAAAERQRVVGASMQVLHREQG